MNQLLVNQINEWDIEDCGLEPGATEPNGMKCLYKVGCRSAVGLSLVNVKME